MRYAIFLILLLSACGQQPTPPSKANWLNPHAGQDYAGCIVICRTGNTVDSKVVREMTEKECLGPRESNCHYERAWKTKR